MRRLQPLGSANATGSRKAPKRVQVSLGRVGACASGSAAFGRSFDLVGDSLYLGVGVQLVLIPGNPQALSLFLEDAPPLDF